VQGHEAGDKVDTQSARRHSSGQLVIHAMVQLDACDHIAGRLPSQICTAEIDLTIHVIQRIQTWRSLAQVLHRWSSAQ
jgi:hypothetical protein